MGHQRRLAEGVMCVLFASLVAGAQAESSGPQVAGGSASIQLNNGNWTITTGTNRTVINWKQFGIDPGKFMQFVQPGSRAAVLNRVTGSDLSRIDGSLLSNGSVYLINPNGVMVGPSGQVRTAGFLATTLDVSDSSFLAGGDLGLSGTSSAKVVNLGRIEADGGDVFLIAQQVENKGTVSAPKGKTVLAASNDVLLTQNAEVFIRPSENLKVDGVGVENGGTIEAARAELHAAGSVYALAINNSGIVRATGYEIKDGQVILRADGGKVVNTGTLQAKTTMADGKTKGGAIQVLGKEVVLDGNAVVDASGQMGGGTINVGGSYRGKGPLPNAEFSYVGMAVRLDASATENGDGGRIVVWSDEATGVFGSLAARGGTEGGNGGFIETSGRKIDTTGIGLDLESPLGRPGTWVLDPLKLVIGNYDNLNGELMDMPPDFALYTWGVGGADNGDYSVVPHQTIESFLNRGYTVFLSTEWEPGSTIIVDAPITAYWGRLVLDCRPGTIQFNQPLSGSFVLELNTELAISRVGILKVRIDETFVRADRWEYPDSGESYQPPPIAKILYPVITLPINPSAPVDLVEELISQTMLDAYPDLQYLCKHLNNVDIVRFLLEAGMGLGVRDGKMVLTLFRTKYAGVGNWGGDPVSQVDVLCANHDAMYDLAAGSPDQTNFIVFADKQLIEACKKLLEQPNLSTKDRRDTEMVIGYFTAKLIWNGAL